MFYSRTTADNLIFIRHGESLTERSMIRRKRTHWQYRRTAWCLQSFLMEGAGGFNPLKESLE